MPDERLPAGLLDGLDKTDLQFQIAKARGEIDRWQAYEVECRRRLGEIAKTHFECACSSGCVHPEVD